MSQPGTLRRRLEMNALLGEDKDVNYRIASWACWACGLAQHLVLPTGKPALCIACEWPETATLRRRQVP